MLDPDSASQTRSVLSPDPDTIFFPSGEKATDVTDSVWPSNGPRMLDPDSASQTRNVLSCEPDTSFFPSGEKATDKTKFVWPFSVSNPGSQTISVRVFVSGGARNSLLDKFEIWDSRGVRVAALRYM
jgi:hypothetical protein